MERGLISILFLVISNAFMTFAWYGHLKFAKLSYFSKLGIFGIIIISWGIAFFEYCFQVPANKIGFNENGGPFGIWQLKVIQEIISISVFIFFTVFYFKSEPFKWNHAVGLVFLILAAYFVFKK